MRGVTSAMDDRDNRSDPLAEPWWSEGQSEADNEAPIISDAELQLICQVAIAAIANRLDREAEPIIEALQVFAPHHAAASVCRALAQLQRGSLSGAIAELRQHGIRAKVARREAASLLALILRLAGRTDEASEVEAQVLDGPRDAATRLVLGWHAAAQR